MDRILPRGLLDELHGIAVSSSCLTKDRVIVKPDLRSTGGVQLCGHSQTLVSSRNRGSTHTTSLKTLSRLIFSSRLSSFFRANMHLADDSSVHVRSTVEPSTAIFVRCQRPARQMVTVAAFRSPAAATTPSRTMPDNRRLVDHWTTLRKASFFTAYRRPCLSAPPPLQAVCK